MIIFFRLSSSILRKGGLITNIYLLLYIIILIHKIIDNIARHIALMETTSIATISKRFQAINSKSS
jgi:hypothetical protein